jgi:hypothetical protein
VPGARRRYTNLRNALAPTTSPGPFPPNPNDAPQPLSFTDEDPSRLHAGRAAGPNYTGRVDYSAKAVSYRSRLVPSAPLGRLTRPRPPDARRRDPADHGVRRPRLLRAVRPRPITRDAPPKRRYNPHCRRPVQFNLGLSCHPVSSDSGDPRAVALIVTVLARDGLSLNGYVLGQSPLFHREGDTGFYEIVEDADVARFGDELQGLLRVLAAAVARGAPQLRSAGALQAAGPGHNHPIQWTGAAGIFSRIRKWFGRGPGH